MKCLKCGVVQTELNKDRRSCRVHRYINNETDCEICDNIRNNCRHEWVYFYVFWNIVEFIKTIFNKSQKKEIDDEYIEL